jgi:hypothetical protein
MLWRTLAIVALSALAALGCKPEIGDACQVSTDCSNVGDRLCDTTQPGGYCTIFNCEPGTCPEEAICIAFKTSASDACRDPQGGTRLERTFCMRRCDENGDCRGGYDCQDLGSANPWNARVAEHGTRNGKVCIAPHTGGFTPAPDHQTGVCTGTDAGFDVVFWEPEAGGSEPDAGDGGPPDADAAEPDAGDGGPPDADAAELDAGGGGADAELDAAVD